MTKETSITELPEAALIEATRSAWGNYMYEECADMHYNAEKSREHFRNYSALSAECERRGVHPFVGTPHPRDAWPAEWYRKAKKQGLLVESEN